MNAKGEVTLRAEPGIASLLAEIYGIAPSTQYGTPYKHTFTATEKRGKDLSMPVRQMAIKTVRVRNAIELWDASPASFVAVMRKRSKRRRQTRISAATGKNRYVVFGATA